MKVDLVRISFNVPSMIRKLLIKKASTKEIVESLTHKIMYSSSLILTSVNCNDDQDSVCLELNKIIQDEEYTPTIIWNFTSHFLKISKMLEDCPQDFFHPE